VSIPPPVAALRVLMKLENMQVRDRNEGCTCGERRGTNLIRKKEYRQADASTDIRIFIETDIRRLTMFTPRRWDLRRVLRLFVSVSGYRSLRIDKSSAWSLHGRMLGLGMVEENSKMQL
jgi:hypothetical protein